MKFCSFWQFTKRKHTGDDALMRVCLTAWYLLTEKRDIVLVSTSLALTCACILTSFNSPSHRSRPRVSSIPISLYVGSRSGTASPTQPLEQELLAYWKPDTRTPFVRQLARDFAQALGRRDHVQATRLGNRLCNQLEKPSYAMWEKDGKELLHAVVGQVYLGQGWLEDAEHEFRGVLATIPPGEPHWGTSAAREKAAYGMARVSALRGLYKDALQWQEQATGEYNGGCGNANAEERIHNYPSSVVWTVAEKPLPEATAALRAIMGGKFTPLHNPLASDNSEEQRREAAVEAGLALGCLYDAAGWRADAESCLSEVAFWADTHKDASLYARAMLHRLEYVHD